MNNGGILIISLHDDDRYLQLSGVMATVWQMIDGKTNWRKIINIFLSWQYDTEEIQSIYKIISLILKNEEFKIFLKFKIENVQIHKVNFYQVATVYADAYDDIGLWGHNSSTDKSIGSSVPNWDNHAGTQNLSVDDAPTPGMAWSVDGGWVNNPGTNDMDTAQPPHDPN